MVVSGSELTSADAGAVAGGAETVRGRAIGYWRR